MAARRKPITGDAHSTLRGIDRLVLSHLRSQRIPGATVAVGIGNNLVYNKGVGYSNYYTKQPMLPTHRTWSGSTGKMFTVAAVMQLHSYPNSFQVWDKMYGPGGLYDRVDFHDAIDSALAGYPRSQADIIRSWYSKIRVNHLLSHCGGFVGKGNTAKAAAHFDVAPADVTPLHNHLWYLANQPLGSRPGMYTEYSNRSIGVMDHVIRTVSGRSYKEYVRNRVLDPIGLDHVASIDQPRDARDAAAHEYVGADDEIRPKSAQPKPGTGAAGGWRTTASDLVRLAMALNGLPGRRNVVSRAAGKLMEKPAYDVPNGSRGLGWSITQKASAKLLSHSGSAPSGGASYIVRFTDGYIANNDTDISNVTAAVTFNIQNSGGARSLLGNIARLVGKADVPGSYDLLGGGIRMHMATG